MGGVDLGLIVAIAFATAFALTNGFHDAANAIATLVATRGATPGQAIALSSVFNLAGAVLLGTAVADTIGKIVELPPDDAVTAIGSGRGKPRRSTMSMMLASRTSRGSAVAPTSS